MQFSDLLGLQNIKNHLIQNASNGRIPHAQLFVAPEGSGGLAMAVAYAQYILCENIGTENQGGNVACNLKFANFGHPDLHFIYPTVTTEEVKSKPKSLDFIKEWRIFLKENSYGSLFDWHNQLNVGNKQGLIRVEDAHEIIRLLSLKSYEGGYKIVIIWMADKMNVEASNKILKMLEEPPEKTVFILITENEDDIIGTIKSRCQALYFNRLTENNIVNQLINKHNVSELLSRKIAHQCQGNYNKALQLLEEGTEDSAFEEWFLVLVRTAFSATGNKEAVLGLISWAEKISGLGRETQKKFLLFCIDIFRQALLYNYQATELVYYEPFDAKFTISKLAPYVNNANIQDIFTELSDAIYHIERNGNGKLILTDLSIKLTRLIHKK